jgi:pSer/pThr/pTyr-binding forkhead associated (FHA) protein
MGLTENFLTIEIGEPFAPGTKIELSTAEVSLGRAGQTYHPDIAFSSQYISRHHAVITMNENQYSITDLNSKHGTKINDRNLNPDQAYQIQNGDRISLAKDTVVLIIHKLGQPDSDETVNFTSALPPMAVNTNQKFSVNLERREVLIDGKTVQLFGKDMDLLMLLYQHPDRAVSYNEIKREVWPERLFEDSGGIPDVGGDEITALVYRLRKRLGPYGDLIKSIPRYGYILDIHRKRS